MSCNRLETIELTCNEMVDLIEALGAHSGANMNKLVQKIEKILEEHDKEH